MSADPQYAGEGLLRNAYIDGDGNSRHEASVLILYDELGMRYFLQRAMQARAPARSPSCRGATARSSAA